MWINKVLTGMEGKLFYGVIIRTILGAFLMLSISTMVNVEYADYQTKSQVFSAMIGTILISCLAIAPIALIIFIKNNSYRFDELHFQ